MDRYADLRPRKGGIALKSRCTISKINDNEGLAAFARGLGSCNCGGLDLAPILERVA